MTDEFPRRMAAKLVRDKIPGNRFCWVDIAEHYALLISKLFEESAEVARCYTDEELLGELADVIEVALCIGLLRGLTPEQIENHRSAKEKEKGSFLRGVVQDGIR